MKEFLLVCALISTAAIANGYSLESDDFDIFNGEIFNENRITEEQKKCIADGIKKIKDENPNLKSWIKDIEKTAKNLTKLAKKCRELPDEAKTECFEKLGRIAAAEKERLFGNMTEEQEKVLEKVKKLEEKCLKGNDSMVAFDVFTNGLLKKDNVRLNEDQMKCVQDGYLKVKADNPNLESWFNDIEQSSMKLAENAKQCDELTGFRKVKCFVQLYANVRQEFSRLFGDLSEEQQQALDQLKDVVMGCLRGGKAAEEKSNFESVFDSEDFLKIYFGTFVDFIITEEQVNCIKEGLKNALTESPELQTWLAEVEEASKKLAENGKQCEAQSGLNQLKCYVKLVITAQQEIQRLANLLSEAQKEILKGLADVVKGCLSSA